MKILMTHRYFWPAVSPYGSLMRSISQGLSSEFEMSVFTAKLTGESHETATAKDVQIVRCWILPEIRFRALARVFNTLIYSIALFIYIILKRPDWVTAATFPPVFAAWSASLAARLVGAKFVYHVQDIHPEVSYINGGVLGRLPLFQMMRWLDTQTLHRATVVITLSQDMKNTLLERGMNPKKCHILNNFQQEQFQIAAPPPQSMMKPTGVRRVMFAGNLGRFQNLETLAVGVASVLDDHTDVEVMFLGNGLMVDPLRERFASNPRIKFAPFLPLNQASSLIEDADVALVSLNDGMHKVAYPSKLLTYAGLGVPVLALVDPQSDLSRTILDNQLGAVASVATVGGVSQALTKLLDQPMNRDAIKNWYLANCSKGQVIACWRNLLLGRDVGNRLD